MDALAISSETLAVVGDVDVYDPTSADVEAEIEHIDQQLTDVRSRLECWRHIYNQKASAMNGLDAEIGKLKKAKQELIVAERQAYARWNSATNSWNDIHTREQQLYAKYQGKKQENGQKIELLKSKPASIVNRASRNLAARERDAKISKLAKEISRYERRWRLTRDSADYDAAKQLRDSTYGDYRLAKAARLTADNKLDAAVGEYNDLKSQRDEAKRTLTSNARRLSELNTLRITRQLAMLKLRGYRMADGMFRKDVIALLYAAYASYGEYGHSEWTASDLVDDNLDYLRFAIDVDGGANVWFGNDESNHAHVHICPTGKVNYLRRPGDNHGGHNYVKAGSRQPKFLTSKEEQATNVRLLMTA